MRDSVEARHITRWITVAMLIALSLALSAQTVPLTLVSTAWSPFTNEPGKPRFALDLVETALGRFGVTTKTTIVSAAEFTPALLGGQVDGSAAAWKDPERERLLIFSQPYLENRLVLVGRRGADVSAKNLAELKGKSIAIVGGYSYGEVIEGAGPVLVRSSSDEDSLSRLLKGGVEYALMDELVVEYIMRNYPKESATRLQIGGTALIIRELFFAIRRARTDAASIIERFNAQLRGMIADRTYHRLLHVDWIRADINGDGVAELVPLNDQAGPTAPQHSYALFSNPQIKIKSASETSGKTGFYFGGTIYTDWASVPDRFKAMHSQDPDSRRSTASIFTFSW